MIKSFSHRGLEAFFFDGTKKGIQAKHTRKIGDVLDLLNSATVIEDVNFPGSDLHPLKGKSKGKWAVTISGNWRIVFEFAKGNAYKVNYLDYH